MVALTAEPPTCYHCGQPLDLHESVAVSQSKGTLRLHAGCADTLAYQLLGAGRDAPPPEPTLPPSALGLSPRELEILAGIVAGKTNYQIARSLSLSEKTVKNRVSDILVKLDVETRTQAVVVALRHGVRGGG